MPKEKLVCEQCKSSWQREQSRGRKPRFCPNCLVSPDNVVKPSRIVIEDFSLRRPTVKALDTTVKALPETKYKGKNSWVCPQCETTLETYVGLTEEPMHWCRKNSRSYIPYQLRGRQEAQA